jgi:IS5 family transposase
VHDLSPAADLLHGEEDVVYAVATGFCEAVAGYQGIEKQPEMKNSSAKFRVAMRPRKRRALPDTPEDRLENWVETAKAHIRAKVEHPFRVIKQQWGFQKTMLRDMAKNCCKVKVMTALVNLYLVRQQLMAMG